MFRSGLEIKNCYNLHEKEFIDEVIKVTQISALPHVQIFTDTEANKITEFTIWTHPIFVFSYIYGTLQRKDGILFCRATISSPFPIDQIITFLCNKLLFLFLAIAMVLIITTYCMGLLTPQQINQLPLIFGVTGTLYGVAFLVIFQNIYLKQRIEARLKQYIERK